MDNYNSDSSGADSDRDEGDAPSKTTKRSSTFVMNSGFDFDLGSPAGTQPLHAWNFTKLRANAAATSTAHNTTSVGDKVARVLDRNETRRKSLAAFARQPARADAGVCVVCACMVNLICLRQVG